MEILNDHHLNNAVFRLIEESQESLTLITPYFDPSAALLRAIVNASIRDVHVTLIIRHMSADEHQSMRQSTRNALQELRNNRVTVKWLEWLHAKIYVSEKNAIIASLNLVQTSFERSRETGVQLPSSLPQFEDARRRAEELKEEAHGIPPSAQQRAPNHRQEEAAAGDGPALRRQRVEEQGAAAGGGPVRWSCSHCTLMNDLSMSSCGACGNSRAGHSSSQRAQGQPPASSGLRPGAAPHPLDRALRPPPAAPFSSSSSSSSRPTGRSPQDTRWGAPGFCIRCKGRCPIVSDIRPLCRPCYERNSDEERGNWCHTCGAQDPPKSMRRPLCRPCYTEWREEFNFIV